MSEIIFAYGAMDDSGKVWLANSMTAEIFRAKCKGKPIYRMRKIRTGEEPDGFLMHKENERSGFIFYPEERRRAELQAQEFQERFGRDYRISPVCLDDKTPEGQPGLGVAARAA